MAEIKIEKKPVWPWVLVALLVIGVIIFFLVRDDGAGNGMATPPPERDRMERANDRPERQETPERRDRAQVNEVQDYVTFVADDERSMGLDHEYTSGAMERLREAVKAKADQLDHDIQADLGRIDDDVDHITDDPYETTHANHIRSAADALSTAMRNMQQEHYPNLDQQARQVEQAASDIDPNTLTLEQRDAVKGFFDRSAELLRNMN
jgi:hypothetical protein